MENKNLVITAIVLVVLLVSMYGVRFGLMNEKVETETETKDVVQGNFVEDVFENLKKKDEEVPEVVSEEQPAEEEPIVADAKEVVENVVIPVLDQQVKNNNVQQHRNKAKKTESQQNTPVVEETREEQPQIDVPYQEDINPTEDIIIDEN